jgi:hypothetical protein
LVLAGGLAVFAASQGSYERAGEKIDTGLAQAEVHGREAASQASVAIGQAGDAAKAAGDDAARTLNP